MHRATGLWSLLAAATMAQTIYPSNGTNDLYPVATSPRFLLNGTEFRDLPVIRLAPLGEYAEMSHSSFLDVQVDGHLVNVDASNANIEGSLDQFSYMSCDPDAYAGNLDANDVFRIVVNQPRASIVILYSETSDHCAANGLNSLPTVNGILTTTDTMVASMLANLNLDVESNGDATILPDLNAYTNDTDGSGFDNSNGFGQSPTTAVAMIILYSITGIITALFVVIIVTGAIRAHRHPERYGPRNIMGRGRQSRARGIARAMLDTLPIVKFGDREADPQKPVQSSPGADVEMNPAPPATKAVNTDNANETQTARGENNADGTDAEGQLQCSICTEDFTKGEEVRVLPCNHKFHPDCVDPWLLNVSGTCPLCRVDLRPQDQETVSTAEGEEGLPPPLGGVAGMDVGRSRRDTFAGLRQMANLGVGSREERMEALRRLRQERRTRQTSRAGDGLEQQEETERRGLSRRFRERFRIRTERTGGARVAGRM